MYVARHAAFVIKRMPETGPRHRPTCPSFEPEAGLSGLGQLLGQAIIEHARDRVELRTSFALSRAAGKPDPDRDAAPDPALPHATHKRMSLRALPHYLCDRAGFNRWCPAMQGRRTGRDTHLVRSWVRPPTTSCTRFCRPSSPG